MTQETKDLLKDTTGAAFLVASIAAIAMMFVGMGY